MHLPGESNGRNGIGIHFLAADHSAHCSSRSPPPVSRILFSPVEVRRGKGRVLDGRRGDDSSIGVNNHRTRTAGANVNSKKKHSTSVLKMKTVCYGPLE